MATLLRTLGALSGLLAATGGLRWFGRPLADWSRRDLARRVALMQQAEGVPFDFLVQEYVRLGRLPRRGTLPVADEARLIGRAMAALDVARLADRAVPSLSGGERQRAQMARCLAQLWDRPASALDLGQQARLLTEAWALTRRGGSCIAVLHDLNLAATYADRVAVLVEGRLAAPGPAAEVVIRGISFGEPRIQMSALATYESPGILDREANTTRILVFGRQPTSVGAFDQRSLQGQRMESGIDRSTKCRAPQIWDPRGNPGSASGPHAESGNPVSNLPVEKGSSRCGAMELQVRGTC